MKLTVNVEYASSITNVPNKAIITQWTRAALEGYERDQVEVGVRIVDEEEIAELNERFCKKSEPTNVLSFPFEDPPGIHTGLLGDVVICAPVVCRQAHAGGKHKSAHWAHMLVHGIMHLRGYDHQTPTQANAMEGMEIRVLQRLGFPDPYA
ncbi:MAG: rRNA maturation RNase YbeY [Acidiferrobacterales bacterium]